MNRREFFGASLEKALVLSVLPKKQSQNLIRIDVESSIISNNKIIIKHSQTFSGDFYNIRDYIKHNYPNNLIYVSPIEINGQAIEAVLGFEVNLPQRLILPSTWHSQYTIKGQNYKEPRLNGPIEIIISINLLTPINREIQEIDLTLLYKQTSHKINKQNNITKSFQEIPKKSIEDIITAEIKRRVHQVKLFGIFPTEILEVYEEFLKNPNEKTKQKLENHLLTNQNLIITKRQMIIKQEEYAKNFTLINKYIP